MCLRIARAALGIGVIRNRHGKVGVGDSRKDKFPNRLANRTGNDGKTRKVNRGPAG
jgi:hypothetical protein